MESIFLMEQKFYDENLDSVVVAKTFDFNKANITVFQCSVIRGRIFNCSVSSRQFM